MLRNRRQLYVTTGGGLRCYCQVDTGSCHGLVLPPAFAKGTPGGASVVFNVRGEARPTCVGPVGAVRFGDVKMGDLEAEFEAEAEYGSIGQGIWSWTWVCFDFRNNRITLPRDAVMATPWPRTSSTTLPVAWDRHGAGPRLVIAYVVPGGCLEKAGAETGDEVVQAEGLSGEQLSRGAIIRKVAGVLFTSWALNKARREGKLVKMK